MTLFDDLRKDYTRWDEAHSRYEQECILFAQQFLEAFKSYIGAPNNYVDIDRQTKWYVEPMEVTRDRSGEYHFKEAGSLVDLVQRDEDGYQQTGLRLTIDRQANSFPRGYFSFLVRFIIRPSECEIRVGFDNKQFSFPTSDPKKMTPVFDYMIQALRDVLAIEPWSVSKKAQIGFVPSRNG